MNDLVAGSYLTRQLVSGPDCKFSFTLQPGFRARMIMGAHCSLGSWAIQVVPAYHSELLPLDTFEYAARNHIPIELQSPYDASL